ncbi:hypothetical protein BDV19DRAFT_378204 [Aspergillus venezuelensis]
MLTTAPHCAPPGANGFALPQLKRKRSDSSDSTPAREVPVATKLRTDDASAKQISLQNSTSTSVATKDGAATTPTGSLADQTFEQRAKNPPPSIPDEGSSDPSAPSCDEKPTMRNVDVGRLRETLEAQLSLEVLLKHNELRLIDQEIAKCQVALEQLRRCAEIPYPGSQTAGPSPAVSSGTGMSVWAPGNGPAPISPAPWGVVNGPYTRHYSRWLLPDPRFDGGEVEPATPMVYGATTLEGRSTRGNPIDTAYLAGKSTRPSRGSTGTKLQSLPSGYPAPKERAGPMIIRRKSDGVLVKLVCLDCRRDNFSSTQGFINHCRIAHNRNFASHDAAAVASGEPVEVDDAGAVVGGKVESTTTAPTTSGFVHPLIRSAHAIETTPTTPSSSGPSKRSSAQNSPTVETPGSVSLSPKTPISKVSNDAFTGSDDTPHLSSLMKMKGVALDLGQLVGDAKTTIDLDGYSSEEGESESEAVTPSAAAKPNKPLAAGRQPMRTTASQTASERPDGHKGLERPSKPPALEALTPTRPTVPYQSPYAPTGSQLNELRELDLSPNTVESNQAPSLVSDDDDFEAPSDSDSPGPSSSEPEDEDGFSLIDVEDDDATRSTTTTDSKDVGLGSAGKPLKHGSMKKGQYMPPPVMPINRGKDEKRVSFVRDPQPTKNMEIDTTNLGLHPSTIDLSTFNHLLTLYDETVRRVAAAKALKKPSSKGKSQGQGQSKKDKKGKKRAAPSNEDENGEDGENQDGEGNEEGAGGEVEAELTADQKNMVNEAVRQYRDLDDWRYGILPGLLEERREESTQEVDGEEEGEGKKKGKGKGKGKKSALCLSKDEAMKLLEWKLKHGLPRPSLLGLLRSNKENIIQSATRDAFASLSSPTSLSTNYTHVQTAIQKLTTLRGIGPATASLILSTVDPEGVPFYSDDIYLWLCLGIYPERVEKSASDLRRPKHERDAAMRAKQVRPNGELNVKYDLSEYRRVWGAVRRLMERINEEAEENAEEGVSCVDVEKVALVVRHLPRGKKGDDGGKDKDQGEGEGQDGDKDGEGDFAVINEERRKRLKRGGRNN